MPSHYNHTRHANDRSTARSIPMMVVEIIIEYGDSCDAGYGAKKYALTKRSMSKLRKFAGREFAKVIEAYRHRNAYVVTAGANVVTVAFASKPIFH
ncbi:hypothetical protein JQ615_21515 [Bradyrhizobium jicamae]|uniref:Uncharacterized protein n=1 Tax=Bradyrhizobium jicamae TaxID=280332 RepID=A0ABS5FMH0_9BRAD|nr:hypothetical protein [Bradyrhizobium jicamae]MBR0797972.1 hypothetical protein [Bradyrhizobium jicamae]